MAVATYTYVTIIDEMRLALNWRGDDKILTDDELESCMFEHFIGESTTITFKLKGTGVWAADKAQSYGAWIYLPRFTGADDCVYRVNSRGSIKLTTGTDTTTSYNITGTYINFPAIMVDTCMWLATNRAQEISESSMAGSMSSNQIHKQLLDMADTWQGMVAI